MLKERIVEQYGAIRYTIGNGCSGGAIQQHLLVSMYPGLLDGIQPNCSFSDMFSTAPDVLDCHLLINYFDNVSPALWANERLFFELYGQALQGRPGTMALLDGIIDAWLEPAATIFTRLGFDDGEAAARLGIAVTRGLLLVHPNLPNPFWKTAYPLRPITTDAPG
jgi:hypothetical protein